MKINFVLFFFFLPSSSSAVIFIIPHSIQQPAHYSINIFMVGRFLFYSDFMKTNITYGSNKTVLGTDFKYTYGDKMLHILLSSGGIVDSD